jgi:hypothetical protein
VSKSSRANCEKQSTVSSSKPCSTVPSLTNRLSSAFDHPLEPPPPHAPRGRTTRLLLLRVSSSVLPFVVAPDLGKHRAGGAHDQQDAAHVLLDGGGCASPTVLMGGVMYKTIRGWILLLVAVVLGIIWFAWDSPFVIPFALVGSLCLFRGVYDLEESKSWPFNRTWWTGKRGAG